MTITFEMNPIFAALVATGLLAIGAVAFLGWFQSRDNMSHRSTLRPPTRTMCS